MAKKSKPDENKFTPAEVPELPVAAAATEKPDERPDELLARMSRESKQILFQTALANPFPASAIKWKPQTVKGNRALAVAYLDARLVMDRLDQVVGVEGWRDEYEVLPDGSVICRLSVHTPFGLSQTKCDVGSPSEQPDAGDRLKAAFSDALKRAAVKFGIGRYLYRIPMQWLDYDPLKKRFTETPRLPDFAKPKTVPAEAYAYHEPEEVDIEVPAAKPAPAAERKTEPPKPEPEKPTPAATLASRESLIESRRTYWRGLMSGCTTDGHMTEIIADNLPNEPDFSKAAVWELIQNTIKLMGWKWDAKAKVVTDPRAVAF